MSIALRYIYRVQLTIIKRLSEAIRALAIAFGLAIIRHDLHAGSLSLTSKLIQGS